MRRFCKVSAVRPRQALKNPELKNYVTQLANQHQQLFQKLYGLM